ncbi:hypothetical protein ACFQ60_24270 [Streptomyces zhihengii]
MPGRHAPGRRRLRRARPPRPEGRRRRPARARGRGRVPGGEGQGLSGKAEWYAAAYLPLLLVVDPREGRWSLCSGPDGAAFTRTGQGVYGEAAVLPAPFAGAVPTAGLPVH